MPRQSYKEMVAV